MARQIRIDEIGKYSEGQISKLVRAATLQAETKLKERTPVDTGRLRSSWQKTVEPFNGAVFNNLPYAAPVVAGVDLPQSWGGAYRSRQGAEPFLDIVAKDVQTWTEAQADKIGRDS
jgi:hypothetical protein